MQINANYSVNGVPYDNKRKQNNIPQFSTECAVQENENINPYMAEPLVYVCDCYQKFNVVTGMPKSNFGDSFGYDMQKDISSHMTDFYAGKVSRDELNSYFEECCTSMRTYRTSQHQTSGTNEADNTQIVSEMYEVFAKENARAASQANYQEGKALNEKYYSDTRVVRWQDRRRSWVTDATSRADVLRGQLAEASGWPAEPFARAGFLRRPWQ